MIINKIINFIKKHKVSNDVKTLSYDYYSIVVTLTSYIHTYMYFINLYFINLIFIKIDK